MRIQLRGLSGLVSLLMLSSILPTISVEVVTAKQKIN
jgi:hypothetical protein